MCEKNELSRRLGYGVDFEPQKKRERENII